MYRIPIAYSVKKGTHFFKGSHFHKFKLLHAHISRITGLILFSDTIDLPHLSQKHFQNAQEWQ